MIKCVRLIIFLIAFLINGSFLDANTSKSPEYLKYVNEIVNDFVKDMEKKYKLHCYGSGGSMPKDVEKIDVRFISYRKSTIEDARKMEVNAIEALLHRINSHEKIRPYLREYPFHADRIGLSISFRTKTDDRPLDGSIAMISIGRNKVFYYTAEMRMSEPITLTRIEKNNTWTREVKPGTLREELVPLMEETYEEALKIVTVSNQNQKLR